MGLFLDSQLYFIVLYVCPFATTYCFDDCSFVVRFKINESLLCIFFYHSKDSFFILIQKINPSTSKEYHLFSYVVEQTYRIRTSASSSKDITYAFEKVIAIWVQTHISMEEGVTNYLPLLIFPYFYCTVAGKLVVRMSHNYARIC